MDEYSKGVIELLKQQESAAAALYLAYSAQFPGMSIWQKLIKDERVHYQWLETLSNTPDVYFDKERFKPEAIQTTISYVLKAKDEAQNKDIIQALSVAYDLEGSLIENGYFRVFETDKVEIKQTFQKLGQETQEHAAMVKSELERAKGELPQNSEL